MKTIRDYINLIEENSSEVINEGCCDCDCSKSNPCDCDGCACGGPVTEEVEELDEFASCGATASGSVATGPATKKKTPSGQKKGGLLA